MHKRLDAVGAVEPWVSRLEMEAQVTALLAPYAVTTVLVASSRFLGANRQQLPSFVAAHQELTEWTNANPVWMPGHGP